MKKEIKKLEAIIDSYHHSLVVVSHNPIETEVVLSRIMEFQEAYKKRRGEYYHPKDKYRKERA